MKMPGKSQASSRGKPEYSKERLGSSKSNDSVKIRKVCIWPTWTESDGERQDHGATSTKGRDRGKASQAPVFYEDPEGVVLPQSLLATGNICWKRPTDVNCLPALGNEDPVVVKDPDCTSIDLVSNNTHLFHSELMCWVTSELSALWTIRDSLLKDSISSEDEPGSVWQPWGHIYPQSKGAPLFNPFGKYTVRLYWMGCWRKVTVDDFLPFIDKSAASSPDQSGFINDDDDRYIPLFPRTSHPSEIWPALLTKAFLKVAALDCASTGPGVGEFADFSVVHLLTGWVPRVVSLDKTSKETVWKEVMKQTLPLWKRDCEQSGGQNRRRNIVLASIGAHQDPLKTKSSPSSSTSSIGDTLKEAGLVPPTFDSTSTPSYPMLLTQARDEPLTPPSSTPALPVLQAPYYLGLKHRLPNPGEPHAPTPPPPEAPRFVEIVPSLIAEESKRESSEIERDGSSSDIVRDNAVWISYTDFIKSFRNLYIFDNPLNFGHKNSFVDLSRTVEEVATQTKKTGSSVQLSSSKLVAASKDTNILFVDCATSTQLHIVFSSLSNWREGQKNTHTVPLPKSHLGSLKLALAKKGSVEGQVKGEHVVAGCLVVEPFVWNSVQTRPPLLRMKTTGIKGATLSLAPGRHVLKLHVKAPIGHHIDVFSHCDFALADEDTVYSHLSKVSSLYASYCSEFVEGLLAASKLFGEEGVAFNASLLPMIEKLKALGLSAHHAQLLLGCTMEVWSTHYANYGLSNQMQFVWKTFFYKLFAVLKQGLPPSDTTVDIQSVRSTLSKTKVDETRNSIKKHSESTDKEIEAASLIIRTLQRQVETRRRQSMIPGTSGNEQAMQEISNSLPLLQPHIGTLGVEIFEGLFELEPSLKELFPFYEDESSRAFNAQYTGTFPPLNNNSWAVVMRVVFQIPVPQTVVPQFSCPVPSCLLRVIDNDTMRELPRVFHSTLPHMYTPNTHGYTFQAEAWTPSGGLGHVDGGRWSLRLISSSKQLPVMTDSEEKVEIVTPALVQESTDFSTPDNKPFKHSFKPTKNLPVSSQVSTSKQEAYCKVQVPGEDVEIVTPHTQELMDYSLPDRDNKLFRYSLKSTKNLPVTFQLSTSKQDAYCKLQLLDNEVSVREVEGRRCCIIPLHNILANGEEEEKLHKYTIQAVVMRDSWPLPDSAWPHISAIKSAEKLDEKSDTKPNSAKKARSKGASSKKGSTPQSSTAQMNQQIDTSKPHWVFRIVTDASDKGEMSVVKDTERADALKDMVQAWETEQPGRNKKAQESRNKFLATRAIKDDVDLSTDGVDGLPRPPTGPVKLLQMDFTPFYVKEEGSPCLLDESGMELRLKERQKLFKDYRAARQSVLQQRNSDREERNEAKVKQLEIAETWQSELEDLRNKLNSGREAIRERMEKVKMEAVVTTQEEQPPAPSGRDSKAGKGKAGKGKKK